LTTSCAVILIHRTAQQKPNNAKIYGVRNIKIYRETVNIVGIQAVSYGLVKYFRRQPKGPKNVSRFCPFIVYFTVFIFAKVN